MSFCALAQVGSIWRLIAVQQFPSLSPPPFSPIVRPNKSSRCPGLQQYTLKSIWLSQRWLLNYNLHCHLATLKLLSSMLKTRSLYRFSEESA